MVNVFLVVLMLVVGESSGLQAKCFTWDTGNSVGELVGHAKRIRSVSYKPRYSVTAQTLVLYTKMYYAHE